MRATRKEYKSNRHMLTDPNYRPIALIDHVKRLRGIVSDTKLALALGTEPAVISHIRNKKRPITPHVLLMIYDTFGVEPSDAKRIMGMASLIAPLHPAVAERLAKLPPAVGTAPAELGVAK